MPGPEKRTTPVTDDQTTALANNSEGPKEGPDYGDLIQMADDLEEVLAQFRKRAAAEKASLSSADPFERILEAESEPKVDSLHVIGQTTAMSKDAFYGFARALFPDDSDLVMVLRELIKRRRLAGLSTDVLEEIMEEVWSNANKKQCQAGLNIGLKARLFSRKMNVSAKALRDSYRDFLESDEEEVFQYQGWIEQYGADRRGKVAEFIEVSLMHDIKSHDPSCSRIEFGNLLGQMVNIKKLTASDVAFINVFFHQSLHLALLENELLACWFDCLQNPFKIKDEIEVEKLTNLSKDLFLPVETVRQKLLTGIRAIDIQLFFEPEVKQMLIDALLLYPNVKAPAEDDEDLSDELPPA
jgi:type III secretion protein W